MESKTLVVLPTRLPVDTPTFVEKPLKSRGRRRHSRPSATTLAIRRILRDRLSEASAAAWHAVPAGALQHPTRCTARIAMARQVAIYFAHVIFAVNLTRAGGIFGRDRTTARHACSRMEDWRDDRRIDRAFDVLEPALKSWIAAFSPEDA